MACGPLPHALLRAGRTVRSKAPQQRETRVRAPRNGPLQVPKAACRWFRRASSSPLVRRPERHQPWVLPVKPVGPLRRLPSSAPKSLSKAPLSRPRKVVRAVPLSVPAGPNRHALSRPAVGLFGAPPRPTPKGCPKRASSSPMKDRRRRASWPISKEISSRRYLWRPAGQRERAPPNPERS